MLKLTRVRQIDAAGAVLLRYGLVAILLFFGSFKFTAAEANGIQPLIANSPLLSWLYSISSLRAVSSVIGIIEIAVALLILARRFSPALCAIGSLGAVGTFAITLTFLVTTPGLWVSVPSFPLPVPNGTGAFLLKDVFLLGAALWSAAESLEHRADPTAPCRGRTSAAPRTRLQIRASASDAAP